jgi:hypothetical protein
VVSKENATMASARKETVAKMVARRPKLKEVIDANSILPTPPPQRRLEVSFHLLRPERLITLLRTTGLYDEKGLPLFRKQRHKYMYISISIYRYIYIRGDRFIKLVGTALVAATICGIDAKKTTPIPTPASSPSAPIRRKSPPIQDV